MMKIIEVRDGFIKFEADGTANLSSFIQIDGLDKSYIAQICQVKRAGENAIAYAKILFLYDGVLQPYDRTLPSKESVIKDFTYEILNNSIKTSEPIIAGKTYGENFNITIDNSAFNKKMLISVDEKESNNIIVRNLVKQFNSIEKNVLIIDSLGFINANKITAGVDFKLPLDTASLSFMYRDCLNDATKDSKDLIIEIFRDLAEYSKTVPFVPFGTLKDIIDDMVDNSHVFKLLVLKNKLAKFDKLGYFAKDKKEVDKIEKILNSKCSIIDISKLDPAFQNRYLAFLYEQLNKKQNSNTQVILELSNIVSKANLKNILELESIPTTFVTHTRFKYLKDIKSLFDNFIITPSFENNKIFNLYSTFLNAMKKDSFLIAGEAVNYIPLISKLVPIEDTLSIQPKTSYKDIAQEEDKEEDKTIDENNNKEDSSTENSSNISVATDTNTENLSNNNKPEIEAKKEDELNNNQIEENEELEEIVAEPNKSNEEIIATINERSENIIAEASKNINKPSRMFETDDENEILEESDNLNNQQENMNSDTTNSEFEDIEIDQVESSEEIDAITDYEEDSSEITELDELGNDNDNEIDNIVSDENNEVESLSSKDIIESDLVNNENNDETFEQENIEQIDNYENSMEDFNSIDSLSVEEDLSEGTTLENELFEENIENESLYNDDSDIIEEDLKEATEIEDLSIEETNFIDNETDLNDNLSFNEEDNSIVIEENDDAETEIDLPEDINIDLDADTTIEEDNYESEISKNIEDTTEILPISDNNSDFDELEEIEELDLSETDESDIIIDIDDSETFTTEEDEENIIKDVDKVFTTRKDEDISDTDLDFIDQLNNTDEETEDILEEVYDENSGLEELTNYTEENDEEISDIITVQEETTKQEQTDNNADILEKRNTTTPMVPVYDADIPEEDIVMSDPIQQGDSVSHAKYGKGVVEKMIKYGSKTLYSINFDNIGRRLLDPTLTEIKKA